MDGLGIGQSTAVYYRSHGPFFGTAHFLFAGFRLRWAGNDTICSGLSAVRALGRLVSGLGLAPVDTFLRFYGLVIRDLSKS